MNNNTTRKPVFSAGNMTRIAILAAAASILFLLEIPIVAFYKLDLSNIPVMLGAFSMGTVPGLIILGLKSLIGLLHSSSAGVGELADFIMGAALLIPASLIYHRKKSRKTALIGMAAGTLCTAVAGVLVNKYIMLPFYGTFQPAEGRGAEHRDIPDLQTAEPDSAFKSALKNGGLMTTCPWTD